MSTLLKPTPTAHGDPEWSDAQVALVAVGRRLYTEDADFLDPVLVHDFPSCSQATGPASGNFGLPGHVIVTRGLAVDVARSYTRAT
jgi:hypothetical protein